jgi:hypothetical protein
MAGKLGYDSAIKKQGVIVTMSTEAVTHEACNLYSNSLSSKARTTSISAQTISIDLLTAQNIKLIYFQGCNITSGDTLYTIQAGTTPAATNYGPVALPKQSKAWVDIDQTYRYWIITATKASGSYIEWGKFDLLLNNYTFVVNYKCDRSVGKEENYSFELGPTGGMVNIPLYQLESIDWEFVNVAAAQKNTFKEAANYDEVIVYDDSKNEAFCGSLRISRPRINRVENFDLDFTFREKD